MVSCDTVLPGEIEKQTFSPVGWFSSLACSMPSDLTATGFGKELVALVRTILAMKPFSNSRRLFISSVLML